MDSYRRSIGPLTPHSVKMDLLENLYGKLPSNLLWMIIWHPGDEPFGVSLYIGQAMKGAMEGFSFDMQMSRPMDRVNIHGTFKGKGLCGKHASFPSSGRHGALSVKDGPDFSQ